MEKTIFKTNDKNPFGQLSGLRFSIAQEDRHFKLSCRLIFGKMTYEHNDQEYEIGVSRAHLRLSLEGCETTLDNVFGESVLAPVVEQDSVAVQGGAGIEASVGANAGAKANVSAQVSRKRELSQNKQHLPVTARPNDSWEVKPLSVTSKTPSVIEGTAIPNECLCVLQRKLGGNRLGIIGEVQVSKNDIRVSVKGGNRLYKLMNRQSNKDAIIGQILKRAVQREAATFNSDRPNSTVAISRCEVLEE